jgi:hypothetical protein
VPSGVRCVLPERSPAALTKGKNPYEEPWVGIKDAVRLIMRRRNVGPETAQSDLREACFSSKVRSRRLLAFTDGGGEKKIGFPLLPQNAWNSFSTIDVDASSIHALDFGKLEHVEINEMELTAWLARPRRGPKAGRLARYAEADRALFGELERVMLKGSKSLTEAARDLDYERKVNGRGTSEARVRRLARLYRKERRPR